MFEGQRRYPVAAAPLFGWRHVAHQPDKARDAADAVIGLGQPLKLDADIEILALHSDHRLSLR